MHKGQVINNQKHGCDPINAWKSKAVCYNSVGTLASKTATTSFWIAELQSLPNEVFDKT